MLLEDAAHELVEGRKGAKRCLDHREQPMLVAGEEAIGLAGVESGQAGGQVLGAVEQMHDHVRCLATHAHEDEDLHHAPEARRVRGAGEDEQLLAAREEDGQARERLLDVELVDARLCGREAGA